MYSGSFEVLLDLFLVGEAPFPRNICARIEVNKQKAAPMRTQLPVPDERLKGNRSAGGCTCYKESVISPEASEAEAFISGSARAAEVSLSTVASVASKIYQSNLERGIVVGGT